MAWARLSVVLNRALREISMKTLLLLFFSIGILAAEKLPVRIELRDQFDSLQILSFPSEHVTVLTIADRRGVVEVDAWIASLKSRCGAGVDCRGIAQMPGVPSFLQNHFRKKFQEVRKYPVMMDWDGKLSERLGAKPGVANVLIIDRSGTILGRFQGKMNETLAAEASAAIDKALARE